MSDIKVGDKVRGKDGFRRPGIITVLEIHGRYLWLDDGGVPWTALASDWELIPDFFEVGKSYRHEFWTRKQTFDVHAIITIGAAKEGRRYAVGQINYADAPPDLFHACTFRSFEEV